MQIIKLMKVGFCWNCFQDSFVARLEALGDRIGESLVAVEMGGKMALYPWINKGDCRVRIVTLFKEKDIDECRVWEVGMATWRAIKRENIGVIFLQSWWPPTTWAQALAAKMRGCVLIMAVDSHRASARAPWIAQMIKRTVLRYVYLRQFDAFLTSGTATKRYLTELGVAAEKITVGLDVVDNDHWMEAAGKVRCEGIRPELRRDLPEKYFLSLGRLVEKKNLSALLGAFALFLDRNPDSDWSLVMAGIGPLRAALVKRAKDLQLTVIERRGEGSGNGEQPLAGAVVFWGACDTQDSAVLYTMAGGFVLPSSSEEWGLTVNEAMVCGCPVIASAVAGSTEDLVFDEVNGYRFKPADENELALRLERLALDKDLRRKMGIESRRIVARWGCDAFAEGALRAIDIAMARLGKKTLDDGFSGKTLPRLSLGRSDQMVNTKEDFLKPQYGWSIAILWKITPFIGDLFIKARISADVVSWLSLAVYLGGLWIYLGDTNHLIVRFIVAFLFTVGTLLDVVDGYVARKTKHAGGGGAILDAGIDLVRYNLFFVVVWLKESGSSWIGWVISAYAMLITLSFCRTIKKAYFQEKKDRLLNDELRTLLPKRYKKFCMRYRLLYNPMNMEDQLNLWILVVGVIVAEMPKIILACLVVRVIEVVVGAIGLLGTWRQGNEQK